MRDLYEELPGKDTESYKDLLRDLSLYVVSLDNKEAEKSLFDFLQLAGDFELLGEMTALSIKRGE